MMLLLAQDSIPVVVDILEGEDIPVEDIPVVVHNLVEEGNLAAADILVMGILEEVSVALQSRIVVAHVDLHLSHVFLVVVVQGMVVLQAAPQVVVLLLVVRLAVPGCSYVSPPILTLVSHLQENCVLHEFHRQKLLLLRLGPRP